MPVTKPSLALLVTAAIAGSALPPPAGGGARADHPVASKREPYAPTPGRRTEAFKPGVQLATAGEAAAARGAAAATAGEAVPLYDGLGDLSWPVTTRSGTAQRYFDQGLRLAYNFNHAEAARAFRAAQRADPACAMCYWGEAYVLGPNINQPMGPAAVGPAFAAVAQAQALAGGASPEERALIGALAARYSPDPAADRKALDAAYADAMAGVAAAFPGDDEVRTLLADALMNLSPWDYWAGDKVTPKGRTAELVAALEAVLARNPDHPGAIHLYIHAVEASATPGRAEPHADRLAALAPAAGHLVHMPSHIYYRVGRYKDSLAANMAAVKADEAYLAGPRAEGTYGYTYYPHNVHFVLVSAMAGGDAASALAAAAKLDRVVPDDVAREVGWVQAIKTAPYFAHARFSDPATILALPEPPAEFPFVRASWRYARAVAHVARGDAGAARAEEKELAAIAESADFAGLAAWGVPAADVVAIAREVVEGRLAMAGGRHGEAAAAFARAVAVEDRLPYMEPPFWYYPVRRSLAAAQLAAGRAGDAVRTFRDGLARAPNDAYALYGLAAALRAEGMAEAAAEAEARFRAAWSGQGSPDLATL